MKRLKLNPMKNPRNPYYNHPLMSKSHAHVKSEKAKRRKNKVNLKKDLENE